MDQLARGAIDDQHSHRYLARAHSAATTSNGGMVRRRPWLWPPVSFSDCSGYVGTLSVYEHHQAITPRRATRLAEQQAGAPVLRVGNVLGIWG